MTTHTQTQVSGKLVILSIVALALMAAAASWWFRYFATHRAAQFWGSEGARIIRDARTVYLTKRLPKEQQGSLPGEIGIRFEVSKARGLLHLRNALLEDRSFDWTTRGSGPISSSSKWELEFYGDKKGERFNILFTNDCRRTAVVGGVFDSHWSISTEPIAAGLRTIFAEFWSDAADPTR